METALGLAEFIRQVKHELMRSTDDADDTVKFLGIEEIELDIQVAVSVEGRAGINVQVVQLGGGIKRDDVHIVKVKLQPLLSHDQRIEALQSGPAWGPLVTATLAHTLKGNGPNSQIDD